MSYREQLSAIRNGFAEKTTGAKPKKPVKKVSEKRKEIDKEYLKIRKDYLTKNLRCMARVKCNGAVSEDLHHRKGRIGKLLIDERFFMAVCRKCHDHIHSHHSESVKQGFIIPKTAA